MRKCSAYDDYTMHMPAAGVTAKRGGISPTLPITVCLAQLSTAKQDIHSVGQCTLVALNIIVRLSCRNARQRLAFGASERDRPLWHASLE